MKDKLLFMIGLIIFMFGAAHCLSVNSKEVIDGSSTKGDLNVPVDKWSIESALIPIVNYDDETKQLEFGDYKFLYDPIYKKWTQVKRTVVCFVLDQTGSMEKVWDKNNFWF